MIYVTGDTHRDFKRFTAENFPEQQGMTKDDTVIICGDFGGIWDDHNSRNERAKLEELTSKPFTTVFCDGNHENFDRLYTDYQVLEWNGGRVHRIRDGLYHLIRGEVYTIEGKKFFVFGGAASHDIKDGILDPDDYPDGEFDPEFRKAYMELVNRRAMFRIKGLSWWPQEQPSEEEYENGRINLEKVGYSVDFAITHEGPESLLKAFYGADYEPYALPEYLEEIRSKLTYGHWFFGHHHEEHNFSEKDHMLFEQIVRIV